MYKSREVRWFFKDRNEVITKWFQSHKLDFTQIQSRTDFYHLPTLDKALGIKIREGKLEVKHRVSGPYTGILYSNQKVSFEDWTKWSFELRNDDPETKAIVEDKKHRKWLAVIKNRMAVNVGEAENGELKIFSLDIPITRGCQLEYTKLEVEGKLYYSFGLEWFGEPWLSIDHPILNELLQNSDIPWGKYKSYPEFLLAILIK